MNKNKGLGDEARSKLSLFDLSQVLMYLAAIDVDAVLASVLTAFLFFTIFLYSFL